MVPENEGCQHLGRQGNILQFLMGQGRMGADFCFQEPHLPAGEIFHVNGGGRHNEAADFTGRNELRTQHQVDIEVFPDIVHRLRQELRVPNPGDGVGDAVFLRQDTGDDIHLIHGSHRHHQVTAFDVAAPHERGTCAVGVDGEHVKACADGLQFLGVRIYYDYIISFIGQELGDNISQMPCTDDNNSHDFHPF